jgi:hypothetical protein
MYDDLHDHLHHPIGRLHEHIRRQMAAAEQEFARARAAARAHGAVDLVCIDGVWQLPQD